MKLVMTNPRLAKNKIDNYVLLLIVTLLHLGVAVLLWQLQFRPVVDTQPKPIQIEWVQPPEIEQPLSATHGTPVQQRPARATKPKSMQRSITTPHQPHQKAVQPSKQVMQPVHKQQKLQPRSQANRALVHTQSKRAVTTSVAAQSSLTTTTRMTTAESRASQAQAESAQQQSQQQSQQQAEQVKAQAKADAARSDSNADAKKKQGINGGASLKSIDRSAVKEKKASGSARLSVSYDANGKVTQVNVISSTNPSATASLVKRAYGMRINPKMVDGEPTGGQATITLAVK